MNNITNFLKNIKIGRPSIGGIIFWVITAALAVGSFIFLRNFVTCWTITSLPGTPPSTCGTVTAGQNDPVITTNEEGTPVPSVADLPPAIEVPVNSNIPAAWDGASRITILLIGLDYRDYIANEGPPRSDTMILLTIDPLTKTAGMMSIPRDMWVNIPGHGYSRINTAYSSGEGEKLPGGGPELARKTVENFIGVPIQYYAQIDFNTFVQFIDLIGCINVDVPETLTLDKQGSGNDHFTIKAGNDRRLCGERALAYVRYRHDKEGDVARSRRQQAVILAIREKVLAPENFPVLLGQAQDFYNEFSSGVKTNMPFDTALRLGVLAKDIPLGSIQQGVIDYTMVSLDSVKLAGQDASIVKPFPDKIRELRDKIFTTGGPLSPLAATGDPTALMQADGARVRILNGTYTPGLDVTTGNYFLTQGLGVTEVGGADRVYDNTIIVLYKPKLYTMKYLQAVFGITSGAQIRIQPDPTQTVDVEVRLGNNWAANNPMPK
jgi:LCP family protein required for cell wall assembly